LYAVLAFNRLMLDEIFALWAPQKGDRGGLDFTSTDIGFVYAGAGCGSIFSQVFLFPLVLKWSGPLHMYRWASFGSALIVWSIPISNLLVQSEKWLIWFEVVMSFVILSVTTNFTFISVMVLVNNSSYRSTMGSVNGFAQTWTSLLRATAPSIGANMLAWSLTNNIGFPLNHYFSFLVISIIYFSNFALTFLLDKSINNRKEE